jgi:hypothetical protein
MADEHPTMDLDKAAAETGLTRRPRHEPCASSATAATRRYVNGTQSESPELSDQFDITAAGRRIASRLA